MKKSFALILCLVFVISIALVTCVAFVPMNVMQVASASVNSIDAGTLYLGDWTYSMYSSSKTIVCDAMVFCGSSAPSDWRDCHQIYSIYCQSGSTYDYYFFLERNDGNWGGAVNGDVRVRSDGQCAVYLNNTWNIKSSDYKVYIGSFSNDLGITDSTFLNNSAAYNTLKRFILTVQEYDFFVNIPSYPVFTDNIITCTYNYRFIGLDGLTPYTRDYIFPNLDFDTSTLGGIDGLMTYQLVGFNISNAYLHYGSATIYGQYIDGCVPIYYKSIYDGGYFDGYCLCSEVIDPSSTDDGQYSWYLVLCLPSSFDNLQLYFAIDSNGNQVVDFSGEQSLYINSSSSDPLLVNIFETIHYNYDKIADSDILDISYTRGYNSGYNSGSENDANNLIDVIWATFQLPIKLLFGEYDSTTNTYIGGLFNFHILGLDLRAFVLSIMSLCLIIACIKIILGVRGSSNG